jgi:hypothetical protein
MMLQKSLQSLPREAGCQTGAGSANCSKNTLILMMLFDKGMYIIWHDHIKMSGKWMCCISGSTFAYGALVWSLMSGMWWKKVSMADELPGEPNMEVAPYIVSRIFSTCAEKENS